MHRILLALTLTAVPALAQEVERARALFRDGAAAFVEGDYHEALARFEASYRAAARPKLLFNIALCHARLGDRGSAAMVMRRYLAEEPDPPNRAEAEALLADYEARPAPAAGPAPPAFAAPAPKPAPHDPAAGPSPAPDRHHAAEPGWRRHAWLWGALGGLAISAVVVGVVRIGVGPGQAQDAAPPEVLDVPLR